MCTRGNFIVFSKPSFIYFLLHFGLVSSPKAFEAGFSNVEIFHCASCVVIFGDEVTSSNPFASKLTSSMYVENHELSLIFLLT